MSIISADSSEDESYEQFVKRSKFVKSGVAKSPGGFLSVDELRARDRSKILVLPPERDEKYLEETDDVPSEKEVLEQQEAGECNFWTLRIRTDIPPEFHGRKPVVVSKIIMENCYTF